MILSAILIVALWLLYGWHMTRARRHRRQLARMNERNRQFAIMQERADMQERWNARHQ